MPRIPDQFSLGGLPNLNSGRPIASFDTTAIGKGVDALGDGLSTAGNELTRADMVDAKAQYLQAKADHATNMIDLESKLPGDTDYTTVTDRYKSQAEQSRQQAADRITNPGAKAQFLRETETSVATVASKAYLHGQKLQGDAEIAYTQQQGDRSIALAGNVTDEGQRRALIDAQNARWDSLVQRGIVTAPQAYAHKRDFAITAADAAFERLPPDQRLQMLSDADKATPTSVQSASGSESVTRVSNDLGIRPRDLAAAISYETGGTFDPNKFGGKGGNYLGLIQFGPEERQKYGVHPGMTFDQQMQSVEAYLRDRGVKPGMGLPEIYRTINGGNPNAPLNASDGNGTIAQHIQRIQAEHYASADNFLNSSGPVQQVNTGTVLDFIPHDKWDALRRKAELDQRAGDVDYERQLHMQQQQAKIASDAAENDVLKDVFSGNPQTTAQSIANNDNLTRDAKERLISLVGRTNKGQHDENTYGTAFYSLFQQIHADPNDPNRLTDPAALYDHVGKDLTLAGMEKLRAEIAAKKTPEGEAASAMKKQFLDVAKHQISGANPLMNLRDPKGEELFLKFQSVFFPAYEKGLKDGKAPAQLLDPSSPDYLGKNISQFKRPMNQWLADMSSANTVNFGPAGSAAPTDTFKSASDVVKAYQSRKISYKQAGDILIKNGWAQQDRIPADVTVPRSQ